MLDLRKKPFYLDDKGIEWVEETYQNMSLEARIGQLFSVLVPGEFMTDDQLKDLMQKVRPGAMRYWNMEAEKTWEMNRKCQEYSEIPLLIASNCETGGDGGVKGGTKVATGAAIGASNDLGAAEAVGRISAIESTAIGCNWNFAPVVDLAFNWRNTIVQTRAFGKDANRALEYGKTWNRATRKEGMGDLVKHFPGDGCDENDQHLCMTVNDLGAKEWRESFGVLYQGLIDDDLKSIMIGHIAQPELQREFAGKDLADDEILPASLSPELLQNLLRDELNFNGLIITDATHMIGMMAHMPREEMVPRAIAAGCDMFLFMNDIQEDFEFMMKGYLKGIISEDRLRDAVYRILAMKASLNLHEKKEKGTLMPPKEGLHVVGCDDHQKEAGELADQYITLVKDRKGYLPLTPQKHKRLMLVFLPGDVLIVAGKKMADTAGACKDYLVKQLEAQGFEITLVEGEDMMKRRSTTKALRENYDAVLVVADTTGFVQFNTMRVKFPTQLHQPWYVAELPTVFVSFNLSNQLIDFNMSHCYINCYMDTQPAVDAFIDKLTGKSEFKGIYNDNVWCGRWDTKL